MAAVAELGARWREHSHVFTVESRMKKIREPIRLAVLTTVAVTMLFIGCAGRNEKQEVGTAGEKPCTGASLRARRCSTIEKRRARSDAPYPPCGKSSVFGVFRVFNGFRPLPSPLADYLHFKFHASREYFS